MTERMSAAEFLANYELTRSGRARAKNPAAEATGRDPLVGSAPTWAVEGRGHPQRATGSPGHAEAKSGASDGAPTHRGPAAGGSPAARRNKYGAVRTFYVSPLNGPRWYDSKAEAARAAYHDQRWQAGLINQWLPQPRFWLGQTPEGRPIIFTPDFLIWGPDGVEVEDVKGVATRDYQLRRAMLFERRGILVSEIR